MQPVAGHLQYNEQCVVPKPTVNRLAILMEYVQYRQSILMAFLQIELSLAVENLLQRFIQDGVEDGLKLATKALAGSTRRSSGTF